MKPEAAYKMIKVWSLTNATIMVILNDLVLIGLWKKQFVFKLFAPENVEYIVIPDDTVLTDCFLCDSETDEVKYIK